jgi:hypothetical protein
MKKILNKLFWKRYKYEDILKLDQDSAKDTFYDKLKNITLIYII